MANPVTPVAKEWPSQRPSPSCGFTQSIWFSWSLIQATAGSQEEGPRGRNCFYHLSFYVLFASRFVVAIK